MSDTNKWFYSLTLNELHQYVVKLEAENEKLVKELNGSVKLNRILENIAKSTQTGYSLLRKIEINKNCECNEHLNQGLRRSLNESIGETNLLLKHFQMYHTYRQPVDECRSPFAASVATDGRTGGQSPLRATPTRLTIVESPPPVVDLSDELSVQSPSAEPLRKRRSLDEKSSPPVSSGSPNSSGYESNDYNFDRHNRVDDMVFHRNYTIPNGTAAPAAHPLIVPKHESQPLPTGNKSLSGATVIPIHDEEMPQNLTKPKSPPFSAAGPAVVPILMANRQLSTSPSTPLSAMATTIPSAPLPPPHPTATTGPVFSIDKIQHLPNKCTECDLSFNLKPSLEQHLLTHVSPTFTVQRAGRGRPAKNDSRILRVTDSDLNILRMNDALGGKGLPDGLISLSALEELRRHKFTGFGRYRCPWPDCGYTPHFLRDLRRHMFKHTGDKKYKCDFEGCDFITVWKTSLLQHQRKKHNMVPDVSTGGPRPLTLHNHNPAPALHYPKHQVN